MPGLSLHDKLNGGDKFKKFFFAVFYTYMMMNTVMAGALPDKKWETPYETYNVYKYQLLFIDWLILI